MDNSLFFSRKIGNFDVMAVSDGTMSVNLDVLEGITVQEAENIQRKENTEELGSIHIICYVIRGNGHTVLIDTGAGGINNAGGKLIENLHIAGIFPENIDTILLTHAHPDHIGGMLDNNGLPIYKNAAIYLHPNEAAYWKNDDIMQKVNERVKRNFLLARRTFEAYSERLHFLTEANVLTGISPVSLPGHTPGHTGFTIKSQRDTLLIWGDIVHFPYIQTSHPNVSILFDCAPLQAQETRKRILTQAAKENRLIAGMHLAMPGFAYVRSDDIGYSITYV